MFEESEDTAADNLGKRQQALNARVNEAVANNLSFEEVSKTPDKSDVDVLFKIDLAAKYKRKDFIIEVLKSGDSLYITRVINKCSWLFDEQHVDIINPNYLHENIFKFMSIKMKKKFLKAISIHVRTKTRAEDFCHYCMRNKLVNIALKFLLATAEEFKKELLLKQNHPLYKDFIKKNASYVKNYIGMSYTLLESYLETLPTDEKYDFILNFRHMYAVDEDQYLDLLEKHVICVDDDRNVYDLQRYWQKFNLKFSRNIMMKHKDRVLANPRFFVRRLDNETFMRRITVDDAKVLAVSCLPSSSSDFWDKFYYGRHKFFLKLIPHEERYAFLKKIYNDRYPDEEFEMVPWFYAQDFHLLMTTEEREQWALRHLESGITDMCHPIGKDYNWYEFINFDASFETLKQKITVTTDPYARDGMACVLVRSARNNRELEKVFDYYSNQVNSTRHLKDGFIHNVVREKSIFGFDEDCWAAFYKLLLSMELYNTEDLVRHNNIYKTITLLYHILYKKNINEGLTEFLLEHFHHRMINTGEFGHYNKLTEEQRKIVYDYLFKYYVDKISECKDQLHTITVSSRLKIYFDNISGLMSLFRKETVEYERVKKNGRHFKKIREVNNSLSDRELLRRLKKDTNIIVAADLIDKILIRFKKYPIRITNFLVKLKIYFPDITQRYLNLFMEFVSTNLNVKSTQAGVLAIFLLGDEKTKTDLIEKYAPKDQNIRLSHVQESVCRFFCYSRPPLPLFNIQKYVTKDFIKFHWNLLEMYFANLPFPLCMQLLEMINRNTQDYLNCPWLQIET